MHTLLSAVFQTKANNNNSNNYYYWYNKSNIECSSNIMRLCNICETFWEKAACQELDKQTKAHTHAQTYILVCAYVNIDIYIHRTLCMPCIRCHRERDRKRERKRQSREEEVAGWQQPLLSQYLCYVFYVNVVVKDTCGTTTTTTVDWKEWNYCSNENESQRKRGFFINLKLIYATYKMP